jgi:hypothetical protein
MSQIALDVRPFAWILLAAFPLTAMAQEDAAHTPVAQPGDKYVALAVQGCADKCPSFEIYVFDSGRMVFRPNNQYNSSHATVHKNGMRSVYGRIAKYLQDTGALNTPADCTDRKEGLATATVESAHDAGVQKASWSVGCANQAEKAKSLAKVFVNQTGMWRNINSDSRYWEKHWETWEYPAAAAAATKD